MTGTHRAREHRGGGRRRRSDRRGQALVELALVLPLLLILLIGVIEFGRAWNAHQVITDAAREGARRAVIFDPDVTAGTVDSAVRAAISAAGFDPAQADVTYPDGFKTGTGNVTSVRIELPYRFVFLRSLINLVFASADGTVQLSTEARMRNE